MAGDPELLTQAEMIEQCLRHIHQRMRRMLDDDTRSSPLTRPQLQALDILAHSGAMSLTALTSHMALAHSTVSGIVDRLERQGFVRREPDPHDRRGVRIGASETVEAYLRDTLPQHRLGPLLEALRAARPEQRRCVLDGVTTLYQLLEGSYERAAENAENSANAGESGPRRRDSGAAEDGAMGDDTGR